MTATYAPAPPASAPALSVTWRDRSTLLTGAALLLVTALAWSGVVRQATQMGTGGMGLPAVPGTLADAAVFTALWGVMMAAMMLPSAMPMILLYRMVSRNLARSGQQVVSTLVFAATYLVVWLLLGFPVYLVSVAVAWMAAMNAGAAAALPYALAAVLVAAGAYQFTAVKRVCLTHCQSPFSFLMHRWRSGYGGTLHVGVTHALYCVGCCWGLMAVLVAAGAMGLLWVLGIALVVFAEKLLPRGAWTARLVGAALVALGIAVAVDPSLAGALRGGMGSMVSTPDMPM